MPVTPKYGTGASSPLRKIGNTPPSRISRVRSGACTAKSATNNISPPRANWVNGAARFRASPVNAYAMGLSPLHYQKLRCSGSPMPIPAATPWTRRLTTRAEAICVILACAQSRALNRVRLRLWPVITQRQEITAHPRHRTFTKSSNINYLRNKLKLARTLRIHVAARADTRCISWNNHTCPTISSPAATVR